MPNLFHHPWIKAIAIATILYFALLHDKKNPDSLGSRLSAQNLKEGFNQASEKAHFISENIKLARKVSGANSIVEEDVNSEENKNVAQQQVTQEVSKEIAMTDAEKNAVISCGDEATISYKIFQQGKQLAEIPAEKLIIGKNSNPIIEKKISGMKVGEIRKVSLVEQLPKNAEVAKKIPDLQYSVKILAIKKPANAKDVPICN